METQQQFIEATQQEVQHGNQQHNFPEEEEQKVAEKQGLISEEEEQLQQEGEEFPDEACLFIGDLARGLSEEQLKEAFEPYGAIAVEIKRDRTTNYSLGYGFAQFRTRKQAADAKKALYKAVIGGRAIRLGWAQKNTNLFVGDLDPSVSTEMLREAFAKFGPIYKEETFVKHRNYGFVRFKHRKHAEVAKREMDGQVLGNRAIRIGWGDANYQRHCVHIQFDPAESEALTESEVISKFEEFGTVVSVNLPRTQGSLRGFGFIYYEDTDEGEESAASVISSLNNTQICGVTIQCNFGKKPSTKKSGMRVAGDMSGGTPMGLNVQRRIGTRGAQQQGLFPVQVMMPVGPQGTWQPVQYMMTAHQIQQFYSSVQFNPHPQHAPTATTREGNQMMPMWYTYRSGKEKEEQGMMPEEEDMDLPPQATSIVGQGVDPTYMQALHGHPHQQHPHHQMQGMPQPSRQGHQSYAPRQQAGGYYNVGSYSAQRQKQQHHQHHQQQQQQQLRQQQLHQQQYPPLPQQPQQQQTQQQPMQQQQLHQQPQQPRGKTYLPFLPKGGEQDYSHSPYEQG